LCWFGCFFSCFRLFFASYTDISFITLSDTRSRRYLGILLPLWICWCNQNTPEIECPVSFNCKNYSMFRKQPSPWKSMKSVVHGSLRTVSTPPRSTLLYDGANDPHLLHLLLLLYWLSTRGCTLLYY
jgi:hypothetical protein